MAFASNEEMSYVVANGFRHGMVLVCRATLALVFLSLLKSCWSCCLVVIDIPNTITQSFFSFLLLFFCKSIVQYIRSVYILGDCR